MLMGIAEIIGCYLLGELTQQQLNLPIPGSVIGMVYLFALLVLKKRVSPSVEKSSHLFISNLALLLIPSSVGIMTCMALLANNGLFIVMTLSGSIIFSLLVSAWVLNRFSQS